MSRNAWKFSELKIPRPDFNTIELMYHDAARHTVELEHKLNFARLREQHLKDRYVKLLCDLDQLRESVGSDVDDVQDVGL